MADNKNDTQSPSDRSRVDDLARALHAVGLLISEVRPDQWSAPTPCADWDVSRLVQHLGGMNLVFTALLLDKTPPPRPVPDHEETDPLGAYRHSAAALQEAFARPGVLARQYEGPLGSATGADRLEIRMYDLLAHG